MHSSSDARQLLRERFRRALPAWDDEIRRPIRERPPLADDAVLQLLLEIELVFPSEERAVRESYATRKAGPLEVGGLDDVVASGIVRFVWGRLAIGLHTYAALRRSPQAVQDVLGPMIDESDARRAWIADPERHAALGPIVKQLVTEPENVRELECATPEWVAARLWERGPAALTPQERLRWWVDRWSLISRPIFDPARCWTVPIARSFRETACDVLRSEQSLLDWEKHRSRLVARIALESDRAAQEVDGAVGPVPRTWVARHLWLEDPSFELLRHELDECGELWGLVRLLMAEVAEADLSPVPHPTMRALLDLAAARPALLGFVLHVIQGKPALLADLLLEPRFSALACLLAARWGSPGRAWDRDLAEREHRDARRAAFIYAVSVMGHHLAAGKLDAGEVAALLMWMHEELERSVLIRREPDVDDRMLEAVRAVLARQQQGVDQAILASCLPSLAANGLGSPGFAAALDVLALGSLSEALENEPIVAAYVRSVRAGDFSLGTNHIQGAQARALVELARRAGPERWNEFLSPVDVAARLLQARQPGADGPLVNLELTRSLRAHMRVLSRAIAAWEGAPPEDLVAALVSTVRTGAAAHAEKGRVGALSASLENPARGGRDERRIAVDLGEALQALDGRGRDQLLKALLTTDEPLQLAQLLPHAPAAARQTIRDRVDALTPEEAGRVGSLDEVQTRIHALLAAGMVGAAAKFVEVEKGLKTLGQVPGRELTRFRVELQLAYLRRDHDALVTAQIPAGLEPNEEAEAEEALEFFRALSELSDPGGRLEVAEATFKELLRRRPDVAAYAIDLFAVRVSGLLAKDLFGRLGGADAARARAALAEANTALTRVPDLEDEALAVHACNQALLLLAIGSPVQALEALAGRSGMKVEDRVAAYRAVALARMERREESIAGLERAIALFGETEVLRAARVQIEHNAPFVERAGSVDVEDARRRVKVALFDLRSMDPTRQAEVFFEQPGALDGMIISHVRAAAGAVVDLVPMMKQLVLDDSEDDVTALLKAILEPRCEHVGWSLPDQSHGGFAEKAPGERDLVITKNGVTLTVIEAVVCSRPATTQWTRQDLAGHFQKLFAYSKCRLFFHLTYCDQEDPAAVIAELRRIAAEEAPAGFTYRSREEFGLTDSRPTGFAATYDSGLGDVKVVFLVLDLGQRAQRAAAKIAASSNPRRGKKNEQQ